MKATGSVRLFFSSGKHLQSLIDALEPETRVLTTKRTKATIEKQNFSLLLSVEADDVVALRAALNTYLRWIDSVGRVLGALEEASAK